GRPRFTEDPASLNDINARPVGSWVRFNCPIDSNPVGNVSWFWNGAPLEHAPVVHGTKKLSLKKSGFRLVVDDLVPEDSGVYTCQVHNIYGKLQWNTTLHV
ncbi:hypothetical protein CAPTEDRAFT_51803, partial [Capitella teleta]